MSEITTIDQDVDAMANEVAAELSAPLPVARFSKNAHVITPETVALLAKAHCTQSEAAAAMDVHLATFRRYLSEDADIREAWDRGRDIGNASLRKLQWRHAQGNGSSAVNMTIHLSKHWLGETDRAALELTGKNGQPIQHEHGVVDLRKLTDEQLDQIVTIYRVAGPSADSGGPDREGKTQRQD